MGVRYLDGWMRLRMLGSCLTSRRLTRLRLRLRLRRVRIDSKLGGILLRRLKRMFGLGNGGPRRTGRRIIFLMKK